MNIMSSSEFVHIFSDIWGSTDRRFCFILGAGASKSSGIRTGGELAKIWLQEIKDRKKGHEAEFDKFVSDNKIDIDNPGASYPEIYQQRFLYDFDSGVEYINNELESAKPGYGYSVLAQILAEKQHNIIITTNFDNLTEEALYTYTSSRPLVCGHESLAIFANPSLKRPLIIKIHRDRFMSPQSRPEEIGNINNAWIDVLNQIFSVSIPVFIGYGGNDGSMMGYLEAVSNFRNIFWCERRGTNLSDRVQKLLEKHNGKLIEIEGFDELMFLLQAKLGLPLLNDEIESIARERSKNYRETFEKIQNRQLTSPDKDVQDAIEKIIEDAGDDWWALQLKINAAKKHSDKIRLYKEALKKMPNSHELNANYASYLHRETKDYDEIERLYIRAIELGPNKVVPLCNYGLFLEYIRKDYDKAEEFYTKAIDLDPFEANTNSCYAGFLQDVRKDKKGAEKYFKQAALSEPKYVYYNANYAGYLLSLGRNEEAQHYLEAASQYSDDVSKAELQFYYYAHFPDKRDDALTNICRLLSKGIRSKNFSVQDNVDRAIQDGHPDPIMLQRLADILTKDAPMGDLCEKKD